MTSELQTGNREDGVVKRSASGEEQSGETKSDEEESCAEERGEQEKSDKEIGERFLPSWGEEEEEAADGEEKNQEDVKIHGTEYKAIREHDKKHSKIPLIIPHYILQ
ncbi:hypothetical protein NDU88_003899 [Pleurodeles waltl]|uniref:Uncharacterized protein n=1 Tax=Pleurodeles waltl TaxID=8319 RepID=A0AAV7WU46_PLEWA|nr:hypothetical protein NDU88_003899 [Pleurodeles waltl]